MICIHFLPTFNYHCNNLFHYQVSSIIVMCRPFFNLVFIQNHIFYPPMPVVKSDVACSYRIAFRTLQSKDFKFHVPLLGKALYVKTKGIILFFKVDGYMWRYEIIILSSRKRKSRLANATQRWREKQYGKAPNCGVNIIIRSVFTTCTFRLMLQTCILYVSIGLSPVFIWPNHLWINGVHEKSVTWT